MDGPRYAAISDFSECATGVTRDRPIPAALLQPLYTEYNIGNYSRGFQPSSKIDQEGIKAEMKAGVLTIVLPKSEKAKPRRISVN